MVCVYFCCIPRAYKSVLWRVICLERVTWDESFLSEYRFERSPPSWHARVCCTLVCMYGGILEPVQCLRCQRAPIGWFYPQSLEHVLFALFIMTLAACCLKWMLICGASVVKSHPLFYNCSLSLCFIGYVLFIEIGQVSVQDVHRSEAQQCLINSIWFFCV